MKRGFLVVLKHSVTHFHFHCSEIKSFPITHHSIPPKIPLSPSLWMNTQTHTHPSLISVIQINNHPCPHLNSNHSPTPHSPFSNNTLNLPPSQNNHFSNSLKTSLIKHIITASQLNSHNIKTLEMIHSP